MLSSAPASRRCLRDKSTLSQRGAGVRLTLVAVVHDDLVELAQHFQVLDDVGILVRDEHQEEFVNGNVHVADHICLDVRALAARLNEFGEVGHVLLHLEAVDGHELARYEDFARLAADARTDHHHFF